MAYTITHTLVPIVAVDLIRDHLLPKKFRHFITNKHLFVAGLAGALTDLDVFLVWTWNWLHSEAFTMSHRVIFHNLFIPILFALLGIYFWKKEKHKLSVYMFMIFAGTGLHILIDILTFGYVWPFFPLSMWDAGLHILDKFRLGMVYIAMIDAAIFLSWLWHEEKHHYIRNFF